jgi:hypothetical protein
LPGQVGAATVKPGTLNCGYDDCVDIYTVTCTAGATRVLVVHACDAYATLDDRMTLTLWRKSNDGHDGEGGIHSAQTANACTSVLLYRPTPGPISGLATVSSHNYFAPIEYELRVYCYDKHDVELANATVTLTTNQ